MAAWILLALMVVAVAMGSRGPAQASSLFDSWGREPLEPQAACEDAIASAERAWGMPRNLLLAVALAESGRHDERAGETRPWPWTVVSGSASAFLDERGGALERTRTLLRSGRTNIDVGCMQINLGWHPDAFASLEEAFEPAANVAYGARFLAQLAAETGSWHEAVRYYHSRDPDRGAAYLERVWSRWARTLGAQPTDPQLMAAMASPPPARAMASLEQGAGPVGRSSQPARMVRIMTGRGGDAAAGSLGLQARQPVSGAGKPVVVAGVNPNPGAIPGLVLIRRTATPMVHALR